MNNKEYVKHFIEGLVEPQAFFDDLMHNNELYQWVQSIVTPNRLFHRCHITENSIGQNSHQLETSPYDIRMYIGFIRELCNGRRWCVYYYMLLELVDLWEAAFPQEELQVSNGIKERFYDELEMIPKYIGGREVYESDILDEILDSVPCGLSRKERQSRVLQLLKSRFHLEEGKSPEWRREAEWPLGLNGEPMRFFGQEAIGSAVSYYFEDILTKGIRTVTQSL